MRLMDKVLQLVLIVSIPVFLLVIAIRLVASGPYLAYEYQKASFPADTYGFSSEERLSFAKSVMQYVKSPLPGEFLANQTYQNKPLYNPRELSHMVDVQRVFRSAWTAGWVAAFLILISVVWLAAGGSSGTLIPQALKISGYGTAITLFTLGFLAVIGWNAWFTAFHEIFFVPGSWQFSTSDTLIRLFPIKFWYDSAILVLGLTFAGGLAVEVVGSLLGNRAFVHLIRRKSKRSTSQSRG